MGKIAFVFAGQGSQHPGMGKSLYEKSPAAKKIFELAEELRPGTLKQLFEGSEEELSQTKNTQPCLYCADLAAAVALEESGIKAQLAAGFSLGEIAALTFSGMFSQKTGFEFVVRRGELMQKAAQENPGAMAAVLKLQNEQVEELAAGFDKIYPVNYNCPGQLVVAGDKAEMEDFRQAVQNAGGKAVPLNVSGGFHSPFMDSAADGLEKVLEEIELYTSVIPVYSNLTARPYEGSFKELIAAQVKNPVRWQETVENMIEDGADTFIEAGAGKTLSGLIRKTSKDVRVFSAETAENIEKIKAEL